MSTKRCDVCNSILFEVVPFKTTQKEIVEFVQYSSFNEVHKAQILQDKWLHPGIYCPKRCTEILIEYGPPQLPDISLEDSIAIAKSYALKHYPEFLETHGGNARIVACVHCRSFHGSILEGESATAHYHEPKYQPFRNRRIVSAQCSDHRVMALKHSWWYDQGHQRPECDYFSPGPLFAWTYKDITGWSEYLPE